MIKYPFFFGLLSGIPFAVISFFVPFYLLKIGYSKEMIGYLFLASSPYFLKPLYAPFLERLWGSIHLSIFYFWIGTVIAIAILFAGLHVLETPPFAWLFGVVLFTALSICCLDVVFDGYMIDITDKEKMGENVASSKMGFNIGLLLVNVIGIMFLEKVGAAVFLLFTLIQYMVGSVAIIMLPNVKLSKYMVVNNHYFALLGDCIKTVIPSASKWVWFLGFVILFKVSDIVPRVTLPMMLVDLNYTNTEIAMFSQMYGLILGLVGIYIAGKLSNRISLNRSVIYSAILKLLIPISCAYLAYTGHSISLLLMVITLQNLCGSAANCILSYLFATICKSTQHVTINYAIMASIGSAARILLSSLAAVGAHYTAWGPFFLLSALLGASSLIFYRGYSGN